MIASARSLDEESARAALDALCRTYWYPLYAFSRRRGASPDEAEDLTQGFFARLLEREGFALADPARGTFRAFLLSSFRRHAADQRRREETQKRGGGRQRVPLDMVDGERRFQQQAVAADDPERTYERQWARTVMDGALVELAAEHARRGRSEFFAELRPFLRGGTNVEPQSVVAARMEMTENALRIAIHRARKRYRALIEAQVADTVSDPESVQDEIARLLRALAR